MKRSSTVIISLFALTSVLSSCKKQEGCTDKLATNYSIDAEEDDGTCVFQGSALFWYDEATAVAMLNAGISSLTYYVDGVLIGSTASSQYWTSAPDCGVNSSITAEKSLGFVKSKPFPYVVKDNFNNVIWQGDLNIDAGGCFKLQLIP
jgi:hypothetical protein